MVPIIKKEDRLKKSNTRLGFIEGWLSIAVNTILFGLKYWAGIATNSIGIIADAWHTLSDSLTSIVVLIAFLISSKPADDEHPFGHGRAQLIASLVIGVLLAVVGMNFTVESIKKLIYHQKADFASLAIIIFLLSVVFKEGVAQFALWAYRKTGSETLRADGWHHRSDAIASLLILIGILVGGNLWWIDGALGLGVAGLIFYAAYDILHNSINPLLGENPSPDLIEQVRKVTNRITGTDAMLHHAHIHRYGDHIELTFHIRLDPEMQLTKAHSIATKIEHQLREEMSIDATIHIEPKQNSAK